MLVPLLAVEATFKGTFVLDGEAVPSRRQGVGRNILFFSLNRI